jgi:hypothetical protein
MTPLPLTATDAELLAYLDQWAALLERGDYDAAFAHTDHLPEFGWSAALIHETISWFGPHDPNRRVTVAGGPTTRTEWRVVSRWPEPVNGTVADVWYGLNVDGRATDLTAVFLVGSSPDGLRLYLQDISVR